MTACADTATAAENDNSWASKIDDPLYKGLAHAYKRYKLDNPDAPVEETTNFLKETYQELARSPQTADSGANSLSDIGSYGRLLLASVMKSIHNNPEKRGNASQCEATKALAC